MAETPNSVESASSNSVLTVKQHVSRRHGSGNCVKNSRHASARIRKLPPNVAGRSWKRGDKPGRYLNSDVRKRQIGTIRNRQQISRHIGDERNGSQPEWRHRRQLHAHRMS